MSGTTVDLADVASDLISANHKALTDQSLPSGVVEAYADLVEGVAAGRGARDQMQSDMAKLIENRAMIPLTGFKQTKAKITEDVNDRRMDAQRQTTQAYRRLTSELRAAVIPKVDKSRELMDRDELLVSFGRTSGPTAAARAREIAQHSAPSVVALLFTGYGKAVAKQHGIADQDYEKLLDDCTGVLVKRGAADGVPAAKILESQEFGKLAGAGAAIDTAFGLAAGKFGIPVRRGWPE